MAGDWVVLRFAVLVGCVGIAISTRDMVMLAVFFESLDEPSNNFLDHLNSVSYDIINKDNVHLGLNIVPYGRAHMTISDSTESFVCDHGENECTVNMMIACGNNMLTDERKQLNFTYCVQLGSSLIADPTACAEPVGLNVTKLKECYNGEAGKSLHKHMGDQTPSLVHTYPLPLILIDGEFNEAANAEIKTDSLKFLCNYLNNTSISGCNRESL